MALQIWGKAKQLGSALGMGVCVAALGPVDLQDLASRGIEKIYTSKNELLAKFEASVYAQALVQVASQADASIIIIGSTRRGKELSGRLAQKLGAGCITGADTLEVVDGKLVCSRNSLGGATIATQTIEGQVQVISANPGGWEMPQLGNASGEVVELDLDLQASRIKLISQADKGQDSVDIEGAETLVCVGKGLAGQAELAMVEELAKALGGLVACTKPVATDEKWLPEERIVGLSGKSGKPTLAICLGISGQVQFTVGIREAKTVVAVNTDQNAAIFQMTDYGIVGDLHEIVPRLTAALKG